MIHKTNIDNGILISIPGSNTLHKAVAEEVKKTFIDNIGKFPQKFVLDFSGINHIDSFSFSVLLELSNVISNTGNQFYITNISREVESVLRIFKMDSIFNRYDGSCVE